MTARWDSYADIHASSLSTNENVFIYEAYQKGPRTYVSSMDITSDKGETKITVFESAVKLDRKALQRDGGMDVLFACKKLHEETTDPAQDQGKLVEKLDERLSGSTPVQQPLAQASADHGTHVVQNIARKI